MVLDLKRSAELARVELPGDFSFDAISDDGDALYLLQHPSTGSTAYNVRLYDLGKNLLEPGPIVDQKAAEPSAADLARGLMEGLYHSSIASRDGGWYFSLYFHPKNGPFIHALNLDARYASCILDLPNVMTDRTVWAMALAPSGSLLYAVNGATGHIVAIDASTLRLTRQRQLSVNRVGGQSERRRGALVFSPDGARLYALGASGILVVNVADLTLRAHYLTSESFDGLAVSHDGARLYGLSAGSGEVWQIEASTGRRLRAISGFADPRTVLRVESD